MILADATSVAYVVHMNNSLAPLAEVVAKALDAAGFSENAASEQTGIPRSTLKRRLTDGDFKHSELCRVAALLGTTPAALVAEAEQVAA